MIRTATRYGVWPDGVLAGGVWPVAWIVLVAGDFHGWVASWDQSLEGVNIMVFLVWAVTAGVSCARHAQWVRSGTIAYLEGIRGLPVLRFTVRYELGFSAGVIGGGVLALLIAGGSSLISGSAPSLTFLPGFCIAALGVVCAAMWGGLLGRLWPSYIAAILTVLAVYVGLNAGIGGSGVFGAFTGYNGLAGSGLRMGGAAVIAFVVLYAGVLVSGLLLGASREIWLRRPRIVFTSVVCGIVGCVAVSGVSFQHASKLQAADAILVYAGPSAWDCHTVGSGSTACLARDLHVFGERFDKAMERLDRFNHDVTSSDVDYLYAGDPSAVGGHLAGATFFLMGTSIDDPVASWAQSAASWYVDYAADSGESADPGGCIGAYDSAVEELTSVLRGNKVSVTGFRALLSPLAGCDAG